jgi:long-chain acyl-CoA synthetase
LGKIPAAKILMESMKEVKPHLILCVPLILEKIYRKQVAPMLEKGPLRWALKIPLIDQAVYSTIRKKLIDTFGGEVGEFIVGGAALSPDTEAFLMKIKFPITVGYGMTETAPLISYTYWTHFKPGSVGAYLKDYLEVKIDSPDPQNVAGEIIVRGEQVMAGYYKNEAATSEVLRDGWLHTGDIGTMDPDGTLYIRGRSKTVILSSNGQNIYPEEIEAKLGNLYLVMESLVVERDGRLVALVYPDYDTAQTEGVANEAIPEIMERNLAELNTLVAPFERVASIVIYPTEFEKTPKKSIRRYLYQL